MPGDLLPTASGITSQDCRDKFTDLISRYLPYMCVHIPDYEFVHKYAVASLEDVEVTFLLVYMGIQSINHGENEPRHM